ncbi:uncharacterized protein LOC135831219 [Planococcus citri]|uniref:uncharacterized protein LOC135831219 n=1 Tax=Planococcus citri TaxID=170843 RepID=UPI0031F7D29F
MSSHLSHKLPWHLLVDYVTPYKDPGISFPTGTCNRIHITSKRVEIQVKNRNYIQESDICTDPTCNRVPEDKKIYKTMKRGKIFDRIKGAGRFDEEKCKAFFIKFEQALMEFAQTELNTPAKDLQYEDNVERSGLTDCDLCDRFTTLLEFGDKQELFKYSDEEIRSAFSCCHGGQAVGRNLRFLLHRMISFYLVMNIILHANVKKEEWPRGMKPKSNFWSESLSAHDGQTFLPHSRKYLSEFMVDLEKTKILNKNIFRFLYFYVMMNLKINKDYSFAEDTGLCSWRIWHLVMFG